LSSEVKNFGQRFNKFKILAYTTIFTILPFTTITFLGDLPSRYLSTSALAKTTASVAVASRLSDILRFILVLPLMEIG